MSPELIELLKYMEHSTDEVSEVCNSERIQKMHRRICQIKASEKTEVKYMQSWEEKILIKQEGIAEGRLEGKLECSNKELNPGEFYLDDTKKIKIQTKKSKCRC